MSLLTLEVKPNTSCGYHRITLPFSRLFVEPKVPVLVFNRIPDCGPRGLEAFKYAGVKIVMDLDDYWSLPASHYLHKGYEDDMTSLRIRMSLERADLVMVTTLRLADYVRKVNPNVVIVPNALPFDEDQFCPQPSALRSLFVYAAGASHANDILAHKDLFNAEDVTLAGVEREHPEWVRVFKQLSSVRWSTKLPVESYMRAYDGHRVALAPLLPGAFNACKSNLKMLEAGAMHMPIIASRDSPYDEAGRVPGVMLAEDALEWGVWMNAMRAVGDLRERAGRELGEYVREHHQLSAANEIRRQIIESFT